MYQNCCKKCGSVSLHTEPKGNNIGLYCDDCGSYVKWLSKDELRAFEYSQKESEATTIVGTLAETNQCYRQYELNLDKVNSLDDCKKILKFLCRLAIKPLPKGVEYNGFSEVSDYFS